jgi:hypothetical protein
MDGNNLTFMKTKITSSKNEIKIATIYAHKYIYKSNEKCQNINISNACMQNKTNKTRMHSMIKAILGDGCKRNNQDTRLYVMNYVEVWIL